MSSRFKPLKQKSSDAAAPGKGTNWAAIGAVATLLAVLIGVPAAIVAVRDISGGGDATVARGLQPAPTARIASDRLTPLEPLTESGTLAAVMEVKNKGGPGTWRKEGRGVPGDVLTWRVRVRNQNSSKAYKNVVVRVVLAPHLTAVPQSVRFVDANQDTGQLDAPAFDGGFLIGTKFRPGGIRYLVFDTRLDADFEGCSSRVRNIARVSADDVPEREHVALSSPLDAAADAVIVKQRC